MHTIIRYSILMFSLFLIAQVGYSQSLSKSEKKKLKKEIKAYKKDPDSFKKMKKQYRSEIDNRDEIIANLTEQLDQQSVENRKLKDSLTDISAKLKVLMAKYNGSNSVPKGTVYAVQIGYYKNLDLQSFKGEPKRVKVEQVDDAKTYLIGYFTQLEDAIAFGDDIKSLGIDDAFVSQYINGNRNVDFDALDVD